MKSSVVRHVTVISSLTYEFINIYIYKVLYKVMLRDSLEGSTTLFIYFQNILGQTHTKIQLLIIRN